MTIVPQQLPAHAVPARRSGSLVLALGLLGLGAGGCFPHSAPPPAVPSAESATSGVTADELNHGHDLFVGNCNRCHGHPDVTSIPEARWPSLVEKMGKKAKLEAADRQAVLHYILASRAATAAR